MDGRYSKEHLRRIRNEIPISRLIADVLNIPGKLRDGYFRFLCPVCSEFDSAVNSKTNLARCFRCQRNFNSIDIVMIVNRCNFVEAVEFLNGIVLLK